MFKKYGHAQKYLINTEMALICGRMDDESECRTQDFSDTKSAYIAEAYAAVMESDTRTGTWYNLSGWRASGLVNGRQQPLMAYLATTAARRMAGAVSVKFIEPG